jgi:DNA (cytosine-5)-methyltransferase 1
MGYHRAGFEVVGVDIEPQPNYPFEFWRADALEVPPSWGTGMAYHFAGGFDAIHASPPCQAHSPLNALWRREYPDFVAATRDRLQALGLPYVIENVPGAPLQNTITLCGSSFGLGANGRQLRRHRLFESNVTLMSLPCQHRGQPVGVYGHGGGGSMTRGYKGTAVEYRDAMDMQWATRAEIAQAIPPAYTEHIGHQLMQVLNAERAAA